MRFGEKQRLVDCVRTKGVQFKGGVVLQVTLAGERACMGLRDAGISTQTDGSGVGRANCR